MGAPPSSAPPPPPPQEQPAAQHLDPKCLTAGRSWERAERRDPRRNPKKTDVPMNVTPKAKGY